MNSIKNLVIGENLTKSLFVLKTHLRGQILYVITYRNKLTIEILTSYTQF